MRCPNHKLHGCVSILRCKDTAYSPKSLSDMFKNLSSMYKMHLSIQIDGLFVTIRDTLQPVSVALSDYIIP